MRRQENQDLRREKPRADKPADRRPPKRADGSRPAFHGEKPFARAKARPEAKEQPEMTLQPRPASPADRQRFSCSVSGRCGGCQLTSMSYREQLDRKQKQIEALLGGLCPVAPIIGMKEPYHYRNKVHAVIAADRSNHPVSGVYAAGTHHVVPVEHCLIEDPRADAVIRTVVELIPRFKLRIYNENTHRGFLRHVVIRTGHRTGQLMVILVAVSHEFPGGRAFVDALLERHPEITTVVLNINPRQTSMVLGTQDKVLFGPGYLEDELCGRRFRISPRSFYQVNAEQAEVLYSTAIEAAGLTGEETLLDAYCGTGTIGLCASDRVRSLLGVELNGDAVRDAKINAQLNGVANARFLCDDAGRFMEKAARAGEAPDVVIMDPPRTGSDEAFLRSLLAMAPKKIVYVSCGPDTLARDLRYIRSRGGYRIEKAVPVDMFPWTEHIETVVRLSKGEISSKSIRVEFPLEGLDTSCLLNDATYQQIKDYVLEHTGLKVSTLYIAQVKAKHGIIERDCYNKSKAEGNRVPQCPPEKEQAVEDALRHFRMIPAQK